LLDAAAFADVLEQGKTVGWRSSVNHGGYADPE
jgi:hypothetical protein